ncbi:MAG: flagellar basal body L-ring protein FlgH [Planctomycetota bacterium]|jgi:flagellar L-ring protein precursor FlgH
MIARARPIGSTVLAAAFVGLCPVDRAAPAADDQPAAAPPTSSLLARPGAGQAAPPAAGGPHELQAVSMFAVAEPETRPFQKHDLIQIVVRETSLAKSSQELETEKEAKLEGEITAWPTFQLDELYDLIIKAGRETDAADLPKLDAQFKKEFTGDGEYERRDDFTARLTAEVIEVLPNGNLVLESRTRIKTDEEESTLKVTGICRQEDVTLANTILSNQLHDLRIEKIHHGELKKTNEKGLITKILDAIFAF